MNAAPFTDELVGLCRFFGVYERDAICCGSVSVPQCAALQYLRGGPLDGSQLAVQLGVTLSAVTRLVDGLVRAGWVERTRDTQDRRRVFISLTEAGVAEADRLRALTERAVAALLSRIPKDKHAQILESLRLLREAVSQEWGDLRCCDAGS